MKGFAALCLLLAACAAQEEEPPLCSFDESGRIMMEAGDTEAACVEPAPVPKDAKQEKSGRLTVLEASLPPPFRDLDKSWPPAPATGRPELARASVPAELSYYIRAFPQEERPAGESLSISNEHVIVLRDGCFFADMPGDDDPLVMFPFGTALTVDGEGFLAFGSRYEPNRMGTVRVGLPAETGMVSPLVDAPPEIAKLCGAQKMIGVTTVSDPFSSPERFNPALRRYGERSGASDDEILDRANSCAIDHARREADRRLRGSNQPSIDCNRFWGF